MPDLDPTQALRRVPVPPPDIPVAQGAVQQSIQPLPAMPKTAMPSAATIGPNTAGVAGATKISVAQPAPAQPSANQARLTKLEAEGPRISRIHNPLLKGLATVGDVLAGTFAPRAEALIPGTQGNYNLNLGRARGAVNEEEALKSGVAKREEESALAAKALREPSANSKITNEMEKFFAEDPTRTVADWRKFQETNPEKTAATPHFEKGEDGTIYAFSYDPDSKKVTKEVLVEGSGKGGAKLTAIQRGYMKAAGGDPDKEETWTPEIMAKFRELSTEKPAAAGDDFAQAYQKYLKDNGLKDTSAEEMKFRKQWATAGQTPERPPQPPTVMVPGPNNTMVPTLARLGVPLPATFETTAGVGQANAKKAEGEATTKAALDYAQQYLASNNYTGPGDEALLEKFFELAKPSSGFRMTQNQMDMLIRSRSWMDSAEGIAYHAKSGQWFPPNQRKQIVDTMTNLAGAKGVKGAGGTTGGGGGGGGGGVSTPTNKTEYDALPKGAHYMKNGQEMVKQ